MLKVIIALVLLCTATPYPAPFSYYQDNQLVHCAVQSDYLACYDTPLSSVYFHIPGAQDVSGEGYVCFFIDRDYITYTNSYVCFDGGELVPGKIVAGWVVRNYPDSVEE